MKLLWMTVCAALCAQAQWKVPGVDKQLETVDRVAAKGPFRPAWQSLENYEAPKWFLDSKFGLFVHWGPTTLRTSRKIDHKEAFQIFKGGKFDANRWAELFKKSGAKYVVPVGEHHDGYAMYDSSLTSNSAPKMLPKRDFLGELATAIRKQGLIFGTSSHYEEHFWFFSDPPKKNPPAPIVARTTAAPGAIPPDEDFLRLWLARCTEMVDKYHPQMFYFDWQIEQPAFQPYLQKFASFYYNRAAEWKQGVVLNSKYEAFPEKAGILDISYNTRRMTWDPTQVVHRPWQFDTMSSNNWFWKPDVQYRPVAELIAEMADVVSKNGAYLLNFTPDDDGVFDPQQEKTLLEIGRWLSVNGDAIYGTRAWKTFGEGPEKGLGPHFGMVKTYSAADIRFTSKGNTVYAIALGWPDSGKLQIKSLGKERISSVKLLGSSERLQWKRGTDGLTVTLPSKKPCDYAFALKID